MTIDLATGRFRYNAVRATPTMAPYMRNRRASGACVAVADPS